DVGSAEAHFAQWAKEKNISSNIFSLDPVNIPKEKTKSVQAKAEAIPFTDGAFDLVISNAAIPNIFIGDKYPDVKEKIRASLFEMLRVVKPGGEIRLGRVFKGDTYQSQKEFVLALNETLEELKKASRAEVEEIRFPDGDAYSYETPEDRREDKPRKILSESYLIKIKKPLA
ncbi:MAG TPA: methyltransferase domain-containing protein, partial [Candidatus Paceibacterota bacterium]|nr:methyltransferase domain-containing protein [Candidatus Paceibacterota bacterium]